MLSNICALDDKTAMPEDVCEKQKIRRDKPK